MAILFVHIFLLSPSLLSFGFGRLYRHLIPWLIWRAVLNAYISLPAKPKIRERFYKSAPIARNCYKNGMDWPYRTNYNFYVHLAFNSFWCCVIVCYFFFRLHTKKSLEKLILRFYPKWNHFWTPKCKQRERERVSEQVCRQKKHRKWGKKYALAKHWYFIYLLSILSDLMDLLWYEPPAFVTK